MLVNMSISSSEKFPLFLFGPAAEEVGSSSMALLSPPYSLGTMVWVKGGPSALTATLSAWFCPKALPDPSAKLPVAMALAKIAFISV
jgi:hypothetical protein